MQRNNSLIVDRMTPLTCVYIYTMTVIQLFYLYCKYRFTNRFQNQRKSSLIKILKKRHLSPLSMMNKLLSIINKSWPSSEITLIYTPLRNSSPDMITTDSMNEPWQVKIIFHFLFAKRNQNQTSSIELSLGRKRIFQSGGQLLWFEPDFFFIPSFVISFTGIKDPFSSHQYKSQVALISLLS